MHYEHPQPHSEQPWPSGEHPRPHLERRRTDRRRRARSGRLRVGHATLLCATALACAALSMTDAAAALAAAPSASTGQSADVSYSSAVVYGSVNPHGESTGYVFQYGTTRAYGQQSSLSPAGGGNGSVRVSQTLTGLQPLTTYHYRILATNAAGATAGNDRTFATGPVPLSLAIAGVPNPVVFGSPLLVEGTLSGTGSAAHPVQLEANAFPYTAGFQPVGNAELTNSAGGFSFTYVGLTENTQLRVVTVGTPEVSSPVLSEGVAVRVSFHVHSTRRRGYARLYGSVSPAEVGALVGFQLLRPGRSVNEGGTVVKAAGAETSSFSRVVRVPAGVYRALVKIDDGAHVSAYSPAVLIR